MTRLRTTLLLAALAALFVGLGFAVAGPRGAALALLLAAAGNLLTWWNADRIVLAMHAAKEIDARRCPELVGLVHRLADRAGLPHPRVFVIDSPHPNAFATGRDPANAAVAVTTGLLGLLDRDEIAGVVAHELAHIRARDTATMTMAATVAGAIGAVGNFGLIARGRGNPLALVAAVLLAPLAATLLQLAISRGREYEADRGGADISGKPKALASALAKLAERAARVPNPVLARHPAAAHLYVVPAPRGARLFASHPDTFRRIAALEAIAAAQDAARRPSGLNPLGPRR